MNRDPRSSTPVDDEELGRLVHDVAAGWSMPPVRLDQPGWRERVNPRRGRLAGRPSARKWLPRLAGAFGVALVLTVAVALLGVYFTLPRNQTGKPPDSATPHATQQSATPGPTNTATPAQPTFTPLPALFGAAPDPQQLVVQVQDGSYAIVDLSTGKRTSSFAKGQWGSVLRRSPDGTLFCLCITSTAGISGTPTQAKVYLNRYDDTGTQLSTVTLDEFSGAPDPRDGVSLPEVTEHVRVAISTGADPRYAYVGWSEHVHPVWKNGIEIVDVVGEEVVGSIDLPPTTDGEGDVRRLTDAPLVVGASTDQVIVGRSFYTFPAGVRQPNFVFDVEAFRIPLSGEVAGENVPIAAAEGCGDFVETAGFLADGGIWLECAALNSKTIVRVAGDGTTLPQKHIPSFQIEGTTVAASPDGANLFIWEPVKLTLTRVALASGEIDAASGQDPMARASDLLSALGRWLVPSADAKMLLRAGIAVSPDGARVYTLGVGGGDGSSETGSAGVFSFDVAGATMNVQRWDPTADFVSLAVSKDGRSVYAAGMPGVDWTGKQQTQPASITVYDAATGTVKFIAGSLGGEFMTFDQSPLP